MTTRKKTLYLIRGVQGSGKSTIADLIKDGLDPIGITDTIVHYEADMFFIDPTTHIYKWEPEKIGQAHRWCQGMTDKAMDAGYTVIVSNTFIKREELRIYEEMAKKHGYTIHEIICRGRFQNVHGVPEEKVEQKRKQFEL
jgi:predicted kinase